MRFSAIASLCAAPLALASSLQADLVGRGVLPRGQKGGASAQLAEQAAAQVKNNDKSGNSVTVIETQAQSVTQNEVIIIWVNNGGGAQTQTVTTTETVTASAAGGAGTAAAQATHSVTVGGTAGLVYTPEEVTAAVGDMVVFTFLSQNHTVTQSAFATPCEALIPGMDSGFMANPNSSIVPAPQMAMQVTVATPIWFYCKQKGHCGKGMTFSINPTANKTQAMFKQMAIAQNGTGATPVIAGGAGASAAAPAASASTSAAPAAVQSAASGTMVSGTGTNDAGGVCTCSCLCGTAAFPNAAVQGIGAFGGMSGAMPMSALEVVVNA